MLGQFGSVIPPPVALQHEAPFPMGVQNIVDANGIGLAVTGMGIVFTVLLLVSLYIAWLPRILPLVNTILPVVDHHHGAPMPGTRSDDATDVAPEVVAAIGAAMHHSKK